MKKRIFIIILTVIILLTFASCSSQKNASYEFETTNMAYDEMYYDYSETKSSDSESLNTKMEYRIAETNSVTDTRKIIKTVDITLESMEFDEAVKKITEWALASNGYIENSNINGHSIRENSNERYASFTIRVPSDKLIGYVDNLKTFNVLNLAERSSDITDVYYDSEARLKSLQTQEERLLAMLENSTELKYMLEIESHLSNIRYQIENYYSTLQRYDQQISFSTINITLYEVIKYQTITEVPKTFGERFVNAIKNSWDNFIDGIQNFMIDFVYILPGLLVFLIFAAIFIFVIIFYVKRNKKNKINKNENE